MAQNTTQEEVTMLSTPQDGPAEEIDQQQSLDGDHQLIMTPPGDQESLVIDNSHELATHNEAPSLADELEVVEPSTASEDESDDETDQSEIFNRVFQADVPSSEGFESRAANDSTSGPASRHQDGEGESSGEEINQFDSFSRDFQAKFSASQPDDSAIRDSSLSSSRHRPNTQEAHPVGETSDQVEAVDNDLAYYTEQGTSELDDEFGEEYQELLRRQASNDRLFIWPRPYVVESPEPGDIWHRSHFSGFRRPTGRSKDIHDTVGRSSLQHVTLASDAEITFPDNTPQFFQPIPRSSGAQFSLGQELWDAVYDEHEEELTTTGQVEHGYNSDPSHTDDGMEYAGGSSSALTSPLDETSPEGAESTSEDDGATSMLASFPAPPWESHTEYKATHQRSYSHPPSSDHAPDPAPWRYQLFPAPALHTPQTNTHRRSLSYPQIIIPPATASSSFTQYTVPSVQPSSHDDLPVSQPEQGETTSARASDRPPFAPRPMYREPSVAASQQHTVARSSELFPEHRPETFTYRPLSFDFDLILHFLAESDDVNDIRDYFNSLFTTGNARLEGAEYTAWSLVQHFWGRTEDDISDRESVVSKDFKRWKQTVFVKLQNDRWLTKKELYDALDAARENRDEMRSLAQRCEQLEEELRLEKAENDRLNTLLAESLEGMHTEAGSAGNNEQLHRVPTSTTAPTIIASQYAPSGTAHASLSTMSIADVEALNASTSPVSPSSPMLVTVNAHTQNKILFENALRMLQEGITKAKAALEMPECTEARDALARKLAEEKRMREERAAYRDMHRNERRSELCI